jgi:hypothetical protein
MMVHFNNDHEVVQYRQCFRMTEQPRGKDDSLVKNLERNWKMKLPIAYH